jgi:branched-chain amino acid transport system substrate-binding protein
MTSNAGGAVMRSIGATTAALAAVAVLSCWLAGPAAAQQKEVIIGVQCDRTGPTQITGVVLCPAMEDYYALVNSKGGVDGWKIKPLEVDNQYKVPQAVEAYEHMKAEGAVLMTLYGTPMTVALNQRLEQDKIATTSPGFGIAAAADGNRYPYLFPIAATYWSQAAASVQFVKDKLGGDLKGKKIAYIFYDNPAGREPLPILDALQKREGFELRTFAVPPPGVEIGAQVLDITQRYRPDFVISHLFGRSPALSIKAFKANGYPLSKVVGLVWASSEADIDAAGGFGVAEGYHAMQFAGAGDDYPVRKEIKDMYKKAGKAPFKLMDDNTVYYNRGLLQAAVHVEAIRNALKLTGGKPPTGTDIKHGLEQIKDFTLGGLVPPLQVTPTDHEGGGWVQVFQVKGGKFVKETDWFRAYRDVVENAIKTAE